MSCELRAPGCGVEPTGLEEVDRAKGSRDQKASVLKPRQEESPCLGRKDLVLEPRALDSCRSHPAGWLVGGKGLRPGSYQLLLASRKSF